jgi:hypothetical protein
VGNRGRGSGASRCRCSGRAYGRCISLLCSRLCRSARVTASMNRTRMRWGSTQAVLIEQFAQPRVISAATRQRSTPANKLDLNAASGGFAPAKTRPLHPKDADSTKKTCLSARWASVRLAPEPWRLISYSPFFPKRSNGSSLSEARSQPVVRCSRSTTAPPHYLLAKKLISHAISDSSLSSRHVSVALISAGHRFSVSRPAYLPVDTLARAEPASLATNPRRRRAANRIRVGA